MLEHVTPCSRLESLAFAWAYVLDSRPVEFTSFIANVTSSYIYIPL
ncbi:hypothetical protein Plhal304r1_c001g0000031 [Plasmopara halstedii]